MSVRRRGKDSAVRRVCCVVGNVLTCEVAQPQLSQAVVAVPPVVEEDGQRVAAVVQLGAPDDPQVLQRQVVELVEGHQHVAGHFSDGLRGEREGGAVTLKRRRAVHDSTEHS